MRAILHTPENADVTIKLIMINVNGDSKYSATGFINATGILPYSVEQSLYNVLMQFFNSVGVTSRLLHLFDPRPSYTTLSLWYSALGPRPSCSDHVHSISGNVNQIA